MESIALEDPPWSKNQLRRLGDRIRDGGVQDGYPTYDDVQLRYFELASSVQAQIAEIDWRSLLGRREIELTSRAKTIDTLQDKLRRDTATPLSNVQDIAGVRFEAEMSLAEQTAVAETIARIFDHEPSEVVRDYREQPHSGYRAMHVWLRTPERVEIQIRTRLQGAWANLYEAAGDKIGRPIRYGGMPQKEDLRQFVATVQRISTTTISEVEQAHDRLYQEESDYDALLRESAQALGMTIEELYSRTEVRHEQNERLSQLSALRQRERDLEVKIRDLEERVRKMSEPEGGIEWQVS